MAPCRLLVFETCSSRSNNDTSHHVDGSPARILLFSFAPVEDNGQTRQLLWISVRAPLDADSRAVDPRPRRWRDLRSALCLWTAQLSPTLGAWKRSLVFLWESPSTEDEQPHQPRIAWKEHVVETQRHRSEQCRSGLAGHNLWQGVSPFDS